MEKQSNESTDAEDLLVHFELDFEGSCKFPNHIRSALSFKGFKFLHRKVVDTAYVLVLTLITHVCIFQAIEN